MSDETPRPSKIRGSVFGQEYEVSGAVMIIIVVILCAILTQGVISYRQHEVLTDGVDALVWTQLPMHIREQVTPPRWVRSRLNGTAAKKPSSGLPVWPNSPAEAGGK